MFQQHTNKQAADYFRVPSLKHCMVKRNLHEMGENVNPPLRRRVCCRNISKRSVWQPNGFDPWLPYQMSVLHGSNSNSRQVMITLIFKLPAFVEILAEKVRDRCRLQRPFQNPWCLQQWAIDIIKESEEENSSSQRTNEAATFCSIGSRAQGLSWEM